MRLRKMQPYGLRKSPQRATFASANNWNNSIEPESQREVIGIQQAWLALDKRLKDVVTIEVPTPTLTLCSQEPKPKSFWPTGFRMRQADIRLLDHFSEARGAYLSSTNPAARASLFAVDRHGSMVRRGGEPRSKYISCLSSHGILFLSPTTFLIATSQER